MTSITRRRLVIADTASDELIGVVLFAPASWSGGRGSQAVASWRDYLFASTDIVRLDLATWSGNVGMCRVADKLRWTREACFRQARVVRGHRYNSVVNGVLCSEWMSR